MRFLPNTEADRSEMLRTSGVSSVEDLFSDIPEEIRRNSRLNLPSGLTELQLTTHMRQLASQNMNAADHPIFMGAGVYDHFSPAVVRHVISRSEFLTSYTPYQPEVSQGTLQSIYEFQSCICALTGMEMANASVYDGASGLAEAVIMATEVTGRKTVLLPETLHPAYRKVVDTYCRGLGIMLEKVPHLGGVCDAGIIEKKLNTGVGAMVVQQPNFFGCLESCEAIAEKTHAAGALLISVVNPVSLGLLTPPGEYEADIVVGDGQSLGLPLSFGGPTFGFFACRKRFARNIPGRVAGATVDRDGNRGFVLTLQTREQHIRREKATSNICTSQQLCALAGTVYLSALGPSGLKRVAELCYSKAHYAHHRLCSLPGYASAFGHPFFHEFAVRCPVPAAQVNLKLYDEGFIGGYDLGQDFSNMKEVMLLCVTEKRSKEEIDRLAEILGRIKS